LYAGAGLNVNENRLAWNAVHIEHFLGWCRRRGAGAVRLELGELVRLHLEDLRSSEANQYRVDQAREALAVFYRGVSGWKLERKETADGATAWQPDFRLKTGPHLESGISHEETVGAERQQAMEAGGWRKRMVEELRLRHYSIRTERSYMDWAERFVRFAGEDSTVWTMEQMETFLTKLAVEAAVSASTQNQALSAIQFLFRVVGIEMDSRIDAVRAKPSRRLPVVLSTGEVTRLLEAMEGTYRCMAMLLYGSGLRMLECCRLRIKDVDFERGQVHVVAGKGDKDRTVMLPERAVGELRLHRARVRSLWEKDRNEGTCPLNS
jgi:hypothetical protein